MNQYTCDPFNYVLVHVNATSSAAVTTTGTLGTLPVGFRPALAAQGGARVAGGTNSNITASLVVTNGGVIQLHAHGSTPNYTIVVGSVGYYV